MLHIRGERIDIKKKVIYCIIHCLSETIPGLD